MPTIKKTSRASEARRALADQPVIKLEALKVKAVARATKSGDIPTITVEGDLPSQYNDYKAIRDDADGEMGQLKPLMLPEAMAELYRHNAERPWQPISSVKLQDDNNNVTRITFTSKYSAIPHSAAEAFFGELVTVNKEAANINNYLCKTMVGKFDSAVFLGPDGKFDKKKYERIMAAMEKVSTELGVPNPLSTEEVVVPLPDFKSRRWVDFDAQTNGRISAVIPNQINFVPCPNAAEAKNGKVK